MSNKYSMVTSKTLAAAVILGSAALSQAAVINIDFGRDAANNLQQTGLAGAPDDEGSTALWNTTIGASPTAANVLDSSGAATPVTLTINSGSVFNAATGDQELSSGQGNLFNEYLSSRAGNNLNDLRTGSYSGLIAGNTYDLYFYGQGDNFTDTNNNGGQNVGIRIGTDVRHTSYDGTPGGDGQLVEDIEFVVFRGIEADATGTISFEHFNPGTGAHATDPSFFDSDTGLADVDGNNSRFHALNGVQIVGTFVPEPSSVALLGLGFVGFALRRRRR